MEPNSPILIAGFDADFLKDAYLFKHLYQYYAVEINPILNAEKEVRSVDVKVSILIDSDECAEVEFYDIEIGAKIRGLICGEVVFKLDIWGKYFFPSFPDERMQWYHSDDNTNDIECFTEVMKFAYTKALEVSQIKLY